MISFRKIQPGSSKKTMKTSDPSQGCSSRVKMARRKFSMSSENLSIVQSKLFPGCNAVIVQDASILQGCVRVDRKLALVTYGATSAFFIFDSEYNFERAVPIDAAFKFEFDSKSSDDDSDVISLSISSNKTKLIFEMAAVERTSNFVDQLFKASDEDDIWIGTNDDYNWIAKYIESLKPGNSEEKQDVPDSTLLDSPDMELPRESIAKGESVIVGRECIARHHMSMMKDEYTYTQSLRVYIGTWNVNGQAPSVSLSDWLACDLEPPDIYAIGFQELDLSKEAFLFNDTPREDEWAHAVFRGLHKDAGYHRVALVRLVGMMLIVFVQQKHTPYVKEVATHTVGTGIMGKMGNKGGVSVRFKIYNTSMCFVNSHLAAHIEEFERRNQDFRDIWARTLFSKFRPPKTIQNHDQVYWLGDLNYRIIFDPKQVKELIDNGEYKPVLEHDQLIKQLRADKVFSGFKEGPIDFRPTYKYDTGTDNWDSSEKNRAPAWCDRILWRKKDDVTQLVYRSHPIMRISDHKPVSSIFESKVRVIDSAKYRKVQEEVMKKLDKMENEFLPQVMLDTKEIVFDNVRFLEPDQKQVIIANTGQVPIEFAFINKPKDTHYCKEWLRIEPFMGTIIPGETCVVKMEILVDKKTASKLNSGLDKLYDILVLHLDGGKDVFVTVSGTYETSCFGSSMEVLANINKPLREIPASELAELEKNKGNSVGYIYPIPKEVWFLVDHLYRRALKARNLFEQVGLNSEIIQIRDWLDCGSQDPLPGSDYSVAEALLLLLDSTAEPIIPYNLHGTCLESSSNYVLCKQVIMQLPELSRNIFLYLCTFLQELLSHSADNGLDTRTIATLFGGIFIRDPPRRSQQQLDRKKANFVYHFLVNDQSELMSLPT